MRCHFLVLTSILCTASSFEGASHWRHHALEDLRKYISLVPNTNVARNVILFIGDGMGTSTVTAARILKGQLAQKRGEETKLFFESLPYVGLSKVYSINKQVPDSASTATAMLTGVKTSSRVIGLDSSVEHDVCVNYTDAKLTSMLDWSMAAGKSAGIVTTTRVTHATPASTYASVANRNWERDLDTPPGCVDIARQLVEEHPDIQVILGGGRSMFLSDSEQDPETGRVHGTHRTDGRHLIKDWIYDKQSRNMSHQFVWNKGQFEDVIPHKTDYLFGLFSQSHMDYDLDRKTEPSGQPSLAEMTKKAIQILQKNDRGFFLLVEGGRIDHGHHENSAKKALYDTLAFDEAVKVANRLTDDKDTLLVATADHSHVMTIAGYPDRGNGILGLVQSSGETIVDRYDLPYTTLAYTNGPSAIEPATNLSKAETAANDFNQPAMVPLWSETHSGEDVGIYASGPMAHLLTGVKENNVIAYVMAHAACVGDVGVDCTYGRERHTVENCLSNTGVVLVSQSFTTLLCINLFIFLYFS